MKATASGRLTAFPARCEPQISLQAALGFENGSSNGINTNNGFVQTSNEFHASLMTRQAATKTAILLCRAPLLLGFSLCGVVLLFAWVLCSWSRDGCHAAHESWHKPDMPRLECTRHICRPHYRKDYSFLVNWEHRSKALCIVVSMVTSVDQR